jgi:hypothetical protein
MPIFLIYTAMLPIYMRLMIGIYRMTRSTDTWTSLNNQYANSQQTYQIGVSPSSAAAFVTMGNQDNGTYRNSNCSNTSVLEAMGWKHL